MLLELVSALLIAGTPVLTVGGATLLAEHNQPYTTPKGTQSMQAQGDPACNTSTDRTVPAVCKWGPQAELGYPDIKVRPGKHLPSWIPWTGSAGRYAEDYYPEYSRD